MSGRPRAESANRRKSIAGSEEPRGPYLGALLVYSDRSPQRPRSPRSRQAHPKSRVLGALAGGAASAYDAAPNGYQRIRLNYRHSMRSYCRLAVALIAAVACGGRDHQRVAADSLTPAPAAPQTASTPSGKAGCPANGQWSECAVFDRLDHAGLAPRRDSSAGVIELAPLTQRGTRLLVGNAELDVFIYPDAGRRGQDEARLDRSKYIDATGEPTLRGEATLIRSVNLLAVLRSRNDHQRERVSDALSAGPPQASPGATLPETRAR
jgi:hypothetical protein